MQSGAVQAGVCKEVQSALGRHGPVFAIIVQRRFANADMRVQMLSSKCACLHTTPCL